MLAHDATVWPTPPRALSHAGHVGALHGRDAFLSGMLSKNIAPMARSYGGVSVPYNALRGAPLNSAATLAAVEGGR
jgi:hypothetical protein